MLEVLQRPDRLRDDLVGGPIVQARDHAHAAGVVLEAGVVEPDGLGGCLVCAVMAVLPRGRCLPHGREAPARAVEGT